MIYTKQQIYQISNTKQAVSGQQYTDIEGNIYKGTTSKTLILLEKADGIPYKPSEGSGLKSGSVGEAIDELGGKVGSIESIMATDDELQAKADELKGFSIAMAIIL